MGKTINQQTLKAVADLNDEFELQLTGNGNFRHTTLQGIINRITQTANIFSADQTFKNDAVFANHFFESLRTTPANFDLLGRTVFTGKNDNDDTIVYGNMDFRTANVADGIERGDWIFWARNGNDVLESLFRIGGGPAGEIKSFIDTIIEAHLVVGSDAENGIMTHGIQFQGDLLDNGFASNLIPTYKGTGGSQLIGGLSIWPITEMSTGIANAYVGLWVRDGVDTSGTVINHYGIISTKPTRGTGLNLSILCEGPFAMASGERFNLDGGGDTFLDEITANVMRGVIGGTDAFRFESDGKYTFARPGQDAGDLTVLYIGTAQASQRKTGVAFETLGSWGRGNLHIFNNDEPDLTDADIDDSIFEFNRLGNIIAGKKAVLGTTDTDGFLYIPSVGGIPTGTPTSFTGKVPLAFDTVNNDLYVYDGSWIKVGFA